MTHFKWTAAALAVMFSVLGCDSAVSPRVADSAKNGNTSPWDWPTIPVPARVVVAISPEELTLGNSGTATATALNETGGILAASAVTWSVEDSSVATVDANGLVRGTAVGSTRIVATISGVVGSAAVTVVSAPIAPLVTVASVTVSLTQTVLSQDETASGTATARDATGNVVNGQMVSWNSSNPRVATVTSLGVVAAISPGTASITATVAGVVGAATLLVSAPDPGFANNSPSPGHPNEPAGFTQLSPTLSGDSIPLAAFGPLSAYELGWVQSTGWGVTQVIDGAVPFSSKNVLNINFPAGMIGGGSPGSVWTASTTNPQNWPQHPKALYQSYWYKVSPNFPANLNANKMVYSNIGGGNKVYTNFGGGVDYRLVNGVVEFAPGQATAYTTPLFMSVDIQGVVQVDGTFQPSFNLRQNVGPSDPTQWKQLVRGQWHHIETLYVANSAGTRDGTVKLWIDGTLTIDFTNRIQWSATADMWQWTTWLPVYGGGGMVPTNAVNAYHRLKDFYVSGK